MELKLVNLETKVSTSHPFSNNKVRISGGGSARVHEYVDETGEYVSYEIVALKEWSSSPKTIAYVDYIIRNDISRKVKDNEYVKFLRLTEDDAVDKTFAWVANECEAYLVNDNGNTICRL